MASEAMFHLEAVYVITNLGPRSCVLQGFPMVAAYHDTTGKPTAASRISLQVTDEGFPGPPVALQPGGRAGFVITHIYDPANGECPLTELVFGTPGASFMLSAAQAPAICAGSIQISRVLNVSPIEPFASIPKPSPKTPIYGKTTR